MNQAVLFIGAGIAGIQASGLVFRSSGKIRMVGEC
jgi:heterodisulfide reductase subunit A-like polyferredoxin